MHISIDMCACVVILVYAWYIYRILESATATPGHADHRYTNDIYVLCFKERKNDELMINRHLYNLMCVCW